MWSLCALPGWSQGQCSHLPLYSVLYHYQPVQSTDYHKLLDKIISLFSVAKLTLESQMSICHSVIKIPLPFRINQLTLSFISLTFSWLFHNFSSYFCQEFPKIITSLLIPFFTAWSLFIFIVFRSSRSLGLILFIIPWLTNILFALYNLYLLSTERKYNKHMMLRSQIMLDDSWWLFMALNGFWWLLMAFNDFF